MNSRVKLTIEKLRTNGGFTLIEILVASAILTIVLLGLGTFFLKGNQAAAKGTWRTHTIGKLRSGMKILQTALDKTSYPSYAEANIFKEILPGEVGALDYDLNFYQAFSKESTEPVTFQAGQHSGNLLQFTTATPCKAVDQIGTATRYTFAFPEVEKTRTINDANLGTTTTLTFLEITVEDGQYTYDKNTGQFSAPDFTNSATTKLLIPDVHHMAFSIFSAVPNPEYADVSASAPGEFPRITLKIGIDCRDPFDARLTVSQDLVYMINTQVRTNS